LVYLNSISHHDYCYQHNVISFYQNFVLALLILTVLVLSEAHDGEGDGKNSNNTSIKNISFKFTISPFPKASLSAHSNDKKIKAH